MGRRALAAEQATGGPERRLVGLAVDWPDIERLYATQGLPIAVTPTTRREHVPLYAGKRQVGRATSGSYSPLLKSHIALASVDAAHAAPGARVELEWTVEAVRGRAGAAVVPLPFFDPPRKRD